MPERTYVIADIGANHDGQFPRMLQAIEAAAEAGVSALKFQWVSDPEQMARRRGKALEDGYGGIYQRYLEWPAEWHADLAAACREARIHYMCTVFLPQDVATVAPHVSKFKVASFEAEAVDHLQAHQPHDQEVIVSLGMGATRVAGMLLSRRRLRFLRCVSSYPAPVTSLRMRLLGRDYDGFSDHSDPYLTWTGALAVAAGARILEAHMRMPETSKGNPDYAHAMTPDQFRDYVQHVRFAELCLGEPTEGLQHCEQEMVRYRVPVSVAPISLPPPDEALP